MHHLASKGIAKCRACLSAIGRSWLHFLFPQQCLGCSEVLPPSSRVICEHCSTLFERMEPENACECCGDSLHPQELSRCNTCHFYPPPYVAMHAMFEYSGTPRALVKHLKYANLPHLAEGMGAILAVGFLELEWPKPDFLIPVPLAKHRLWKRGYNQSDLLASSLGRILKIPVLHHALQRKHAGPSQSSLPLEQRLRLRAEDFYLHAAATIQHKTLLVIDDVHTTGTTLNCCAEALLEAAPKALYALTFCRTQMDKRDALSDNAPQRSQL